MKLLNAILVCFLLLGLWLCPFFASGQSRVSYEHYSVENGMAQNSVSEIFTDDVGFVWFTTRDGLSRFDGYGFKNFKANSRSLGVSVSNDFKSVICSGKEYFWLLNNMGQVLRFNIKKELFEIFPTVEENKGSRFIMISQMKKMSNGDLWLIGEDNGCVRLRINEEDGSVVSTFFCNKTQPNVGRKVSSVFEETEGHNVWLLTDNGLAVVGVADTIPVGYYLNDFDGRHNKLFAAERIDGGVLVSTTGGRLFVYDDLKRRFSERKLAIDSDINNIISLRNGLCMLTTSGSGCYLYDYKNDNFRKVNVPCLNIVFSAKDSNGNVWMKSNERPHFICYDVEHNEYKIFRFSYNGNLEPPMVNGVLPDSSFSFIDSQDYLWAMPLHGKRSWYDGNFESETMIHRSFRDKNGITWITSRYNGVFKCVPLSSNFDFTQSKKSSNYIEANDELAVMEDDKNRVWHACRDGAVRIYSDDGIYVGSLSANGSISKSDVTFGRCVSMMQARNGVVWLGTPNGVYRLTPNGAGYLVKMFNVGEDSPSRMFVKDMLEDSKGRVWFATRDGGLMLAENPNSESLLVVHKNSKMAGNYPPTVLHTHSLYEDSFGNIWLGANEGITIFSVDFEKPEDIKFFFYNSENSNLENSCIYDICQDRDGLMWFASFGGGLFNIPSRFCLGDTPDFVSFNSNNGQFTSDLAISVCEDKNGMIWVLTEDAVVRFDKSKSVAEPFGTVRGLDHRGFPEQGIVRRHCGDICVISSFGHYIFDPENTEGSNFVPPIAFTFLSVPNALNEKFSVGANFHDNIVLPSNQNDFSIEFSALDYRSPSDIRYAYILENFETQWHYVGSQRLASYTNLPKGKYRFIVRSTNSEGTWVDNERVLNIEVLPSFWETFGAKILIVFIVLAVVSTIIFILLKFYRLRSKMAFDAQMSAVKLQFFTEVSHELRTPLTLINAPLENVLANGNLQQADRDQLEVVHTNTNRMLRLLNQILDFRKIQSNKMRLRVEKTKLGEFVSSCSSNFLKLAENRDIKLEILDNTNGVYFWVDRDKIDTIVFNLLSNAFKFTPSGKRVTIQTYVDGEECVLRVADEGCGMPKNKLSIIFDRYITLQNYSLTKQSGTGIGLSLVKEIVDMHKATISVDSKENEGSVFEIRFKSGTDHFDEQADIILRDDEMPQVSSPSEQKREKETGRQTLLVIEDNDQMREFLVSVLSKRFTVYEAPNGKVGLDMTIEKMPDFVITDIMMPVMDGVEYVRNVRSNIVVSHIPIVLLTAKTDVQSKIDCFKIGANDYITKPFSMPYLEARIDNILMERKRWQEKYRRSLMGGHVDGADSAEINDDEGGEEMNAVSADNQFMQDFVDFVEKNIENPDLNMEMVQDALKISRWHLISKVKSLVGQTPNNFIRELRLINAARLLKSGDYTVTQVAYKIGISDSRYFSRCFKQKYGVTPTEYKEK